MYHFPLAVASLGIELKILLSNSCIALRKRHIFQISNISINKKVVKTESRDLIASLMHLCRLKRK